MPDSTFGPLRIWDGARPVAIRGLAGQAGDLPDGEVGALQPLAEHLAAQEVCAAP